MHKLQPLLDRNRAWAEGMVAEDPQYFSRLAAQQTPEYLWIGCSDSRVPANQIIGLAPGEVFVHRNVANQVVHSDLNCLSVVQYAIEVLRVKHVLVVGHYGCGGVRAVLDGMRVGLVDNWLRHVEDVQQHHLSRLQAIEDQTLRADRLCELNVVEQVANLCRTTVVRDAWQRGQNLTIHGWCYSLQNGLVRDLEMSVDHERGLQAAYLSAVEDIAR